MYPELFSIGGFTMHSFGLMMALAFIAAGFVAHWQFKQRGVRPDFIYGLLIAAVVGGLLGAKIHYLIIHPDEWPGNFLSGGGLVWFGGLFGAIVAVVIVTSSLQRRGWPPSWMRGRHPSPSDTPWGGWAASCGAMTMGSPPTCPGGSRSPRACRRPPSRCIPPNSTRWPASLVIFALIVWVISPRFKREGPLIFAYLATGRCRTLPRGVRAHQRSRGFGPDPAAVDQRGPLLHRYRRHVVFRHLRPTAPGADGHCSRDGGRRRGGQSRQERSPGHGIGEGAQVKRLLRRRTGGHQRAWSAGLALFLPVLLLAAVSCGSASPEGGSGVTEYTEAGGPQASDFSGVTLDGDEVSLSGFRGKPLVLAFVASW